MKTYYRDFYGSTASIGPTKDGRYRLRVAASNSKASINKVYHTERGARNALWRCSDGWAKVSK